MPAGKRRDACPVCGKPPVAGAAPFCSQGCKDRDLLQWLSDGYRIPGPPLEEEDGSDGLGVDGLDRGGDGT